MPITGNPPVYTRGYSFRQHSVDQPTVPQPGDKIDQELDDIAAAANQGNAALQGLLNPDGSLKDGAVHPSTLAPGLYDQLVADAAGDLQPLVTAASHAAQEAARAAVFSVGSEHSAATSAQDAWAALASVNQTVSDATTLAGIAYDAAARARASEANAGNSATTASAAMVNALTHEELAEKWAEYLAGPVMPAPPGWPEAIDDGLWSAKWWALRAREIVGAWGGLYLGAFAQAPLTAGNGSPLLPGSLYFDTSRGKMLVWNGAAWVDMQTPAASASSRFVYISAAGQAVFDGPDVDGVALIFDPRDPEPVDVHVNGVRLVQGIDFDVDHANHAVTTAQPLPAGATVQVDLLVPASKLAPGGVLNHKIVDIDLDPQGNAGQIDGTRTQFSLRFTDTFSALIEPVPPGSAAQLSIHLDGVEQEPGVDYTRLGSAVVFTVPPRPGTRFWGIYMQPGGGGGAAQGAALAPPLPPLDQSLDAYAWEPNAGVMQWHDLRTLPATVATPQQLIDRTALPATHLVQGKIVYVQSLRQAFRLTVPPASLTNTLADWARDERVFLKQLAALPDTPTASARHGDVQITVELGKTEIKVFDGYYANAWQLILGEEEIRRWIAMGSSFRGTVSNVAAPGAILLAALPPPAAGNTAHYWIWTGADIVVDAQTPTIGAALQGLTLHVGDWIMSTGASWAAVPADLLSKTRGDHLYGLLPWRQGAWEQGALVYFDEAIWRATTAIVAGDAPPATNLSTVVIAGVRFDGRMTDAAALDAWVQATPPVAGNAGAWVYADFAGVVTLPNLGTQLAFAQGEVIFNTGSLGMASEGYANVGPVTLPAQVPAKTINPGAHLADLTLQAQVNAFPQPDGFTSGAWASVTAPLQGPPGVGLMPAGSTLMVLEHPSQGTRGFSLVRPTGGVVIYNGGYPSDPTAPGMRAIILNQVALVALAQTGVHQMTVGEWYRVGGPGPYTDPGAGTGAGNLAALAPTLAQDDAIVLTQLAPTVEYIRIPRGANKVLYPQTFIGIGSGTGAINAGAAPTPPAGVAVAAYTPVPAVNPSYTYTPPAAIGKWQRLSLRSGIVTVADDTAFPVVPPTEDTLVFVARSARRNYEPALYRWDTATADWLPLFSEVDQLLHVGGSIAAFATIVPTVPFAIGYAAQEEQWGFWENNAWRWQLGTTGWRRDFSVTIPAGSAAGARLAILKGFTSTDSIYDIVVRERRANGSIYELKYNTAANGHANAKLVPLDFHVVGSAQLAFFRSGWEGTAHYWLSLELKQTLAADLVLDMVVKSDLTDLTSVTAVVSAEPVGFVGIQADASSRYPSGELEKWLLAQSGDSNAASPVGNSGANTEGQTLQLEGGKLYAQSGTVVNVNNATEAFLRINGLGGTLQYNNARVKRIWALDHSANNAAVAANPVPGGNEFQVTHATGKKPKQGVEGCFDLTLDLRNPSLIVATYRITYTAEDDHVIELGWDIIWDNPTKRVDGFSFYYSKYNGQTVEWRVFND